MKGAWHDDAGAGVIQHLSSLGHRAGAEQGEGSQWDRLGTAECHRPVPGKGLSPAATQLLTAPAVFPGWVGLRAGGAAASGAEHDAAWLPHDPLGEQLGLGTWEP